MPGTRKGAVWSGPGGCVQSSSREPWTGRGAILGLSWSCLARMQMYAGEIEKGRSMMALNVSFFLGIPVANVRG